MQVAILTEGGEKRGLGHVIRCSAIYEAFIEIGIKPVVYIDLSDKIYYKTLEFKEVNWLENKEVLKTLENFDIVIVDSYIADYDLYEEISSKVKIPVFLDDNARIDYPRGIIVNFSLCAEKIFENRKNESNYYLLGPQYIPIRKAFLEISKIRKDKKDRINQIFLMFGGTDVINLSAKVLKLLKENTFSSFRKVVVTGSRKIAIDIRQNFPDVEVLLNPDPGVLARKMAMSDLAISAAGMTLYELAYLQIPTIAICVADNQRRGLYEFVNKGYLKEYLSYEDPLLLSKIRSSLHFMMSNYTKVRRRSLIGRNIVDGRGSKRLVNKLVRFYREKSIDTRR
ncbi:spore coat polysaccharide biosynthesis predicted glycosyltransferase SpsG [Thermovibrio guaymasensis]|uniref:Spore coat polysaccharide biosynthesis predicted glycosyltransferase SpsG n=1 Tax=Thermovibrio guaymasensis TaxID=240167 RepID=A0A420W9M5_9BACT|nr:hypothetical protein [Thermovibrio guaymasensis]RKQ64033.1 spore coat polysaccharide biosynthesis predicted glycosyltransferase SpsG [Thermovibrio guaymasensis]